MTTEQWAAICLGCGVKGTLYERVEFVCGRCHGSVMPLDEPLARAALRGIVAEADAEGTNDDMTLDAVMQPTDQQIIEAVKRYGAALAAFRTEQRRLHDNGYAGNRDEGAAMDRRNEARYAALDALAALALARATPDADAS